MDALDLARIFTDRQQDKVEPVRSTTVTAIATSDSSAGVVYVDFGGMTISGDDSQSVPIATTVAVQKGDTVRVELLGADGKAKTPTAMGVVGGGDRTQKAVTEAKDDAGKAKDTAKQASDKASQAQSAADGAKQTAAEAKEETKMLKNLIRETEEGITLGKSEDGLTYSTPYVALDASGSYKIKDTSNTTLMQLSGNALVFDGRAVRMGQSSGAHLEMCNARDYLDGEMKSVSEAALMSNGSSSLIAINGEHAVSIEAHSANDEAEIMAKRINFHDLSDPINTSVGGTVKEWKEAFEGGRNVKNLEVKIKDEFREILESVFASITDLKAKTDDTKDHVIEQYFSPERTTWSWRKWKSGLCEMWVIAGVDSTSGWSKVGSAEIWSYREYFHLPIRLTALEDVQLTTDWDGWVTSGSENPNFDSLGRVYFTLYQPTGSDGLDKKHTIRIYVRGRYK